MTDSSQQGPTARLFTLSKRMLQRLLRMAEHRLALATVELEEEKQQLLKLLLLAGAALLCLAFALMSLLLLVIWAIDPAYRLTALILLCVTLFILAAIGAFNTLRLSRKSTLLVETRRQLQQDFKALQGSADD